MIETGKDLEFFKVFLPEFSSHELVIPPAFIDILNKPLPKEALLLDEIGRLWSVETKTEDTKERLCVMFTKGWESFANDHSLEFGDFLVFRFDGDLRFSVTIFAKDGCKKDLSIVTATDRSRVSLQNEPVIKPVRCFTKPERRNDYGNKVTQKRRYASYPSVSVIDEPELDAIEIEPEYKKISRRKLDLDEDPYDKSWVPETNHKGFEEEPVYQPETSHKRFEEKPNYKPETNHKGFEEEPVYKPKTPHFVRTMNYSSMHRLEIPASFLKSNGIALEEDIEICDENGKKWPMKVETFKQKEIDRGLKLSHELWLRFCKSHKLKTDNKCVFEFIIGSNGRCSEIEVRIFRGNLMTRTTRSRYHVVAM